MTRSLTVVALLALAAAVHSSTVLSNTAVRQPVVPEDAIGFFTLAQAPDVAPTCPQTIRHTATVGEEPFEIAHANMIQNGGVCNDGGAMSVFLQARDARAEVGIDQRRLVNQFLQSGETFIWGVEGEGRKCNGTSEESRLAAGTLIILFNPRAAIRFVFNFLPGRRYMIVSDPSRRNNCFYRAPLRGSVPEPPVATTSGPDEEEEETSPPPPPVTQPPSTAPPTTTIIAVAVPVPVVPDTADMDGDIDNDGVAEVPAGADDGDLPSLQPEESASESISPDDEFGEASPEDDDDGSVCFPARSVVELESGEKKTINQVELGDRLKVGDGVYSDVFMFTHKDESVVHEFVRLDTVSGHSLSATKGHYLYVNNLFVAAGSAKTGDLLELGDGSKTVITRVSVEKDIGLFNPQTIHGDIIVNSIRASTFTRTIEPSTAQAMLAPFRMMYDAFGWSSAFLDNGSDFIAQMLPKGAVAL